MGGRALKLIGIETERKTTEDFYKIEFEVISILKTLFETDFEKVKFYRSKETHGDCDILVLNKGNLCDVDKKLKEKFGSLFKNGTIRSFEYKKFQIDFIPIPLRNWETSKHFFSYDPVGNLTGKLCHKLGLKYGFQGLCYPFRNFNGRLSEDITISKDMEKIHKFLGLDHDRYKKGFDELKEIFDFIISSKYFNKENFLFENLNTIDKKRNKKRKTYNEFIQYINNTDGIYSNELYKNKSDYLNYINEFFPEAELLVKLDKIKKRDDELKTISEKFNGNIIMGLIDLKGKELGGFITKYKESKSNFEQFVVGSSEDEIKEDIIKFYKFVK